MLHRRILVVILSGVLAVMTAPSVLAQSLSADVKFTCDTANAATSVSHCSFQVPADTIGAMLMIEITKGNATQVTNLKKGDNVSGSSTFFHLDVGEANGNISLRVDFADLKAKAFSASPYILFQFDVGLSNVQPSAFPMTIAALLKKGSELHNPNSLANNSTAFTASADVPLSLVIQATQATAAPVNSSFTPIPSSFNTDDTTVHGAAPALHCFDDPPDSMTDEEWTIICDAKTRGIISGSPQADNRSFFLPNQPINRAEAAKIITLGILRSLGKLNDRNFSAEGARLKNEAVARKSIIYTDVLYEDSGAAPWYAEYITLASKAKIVAGYPDNTYKPADKINNAEAYKVIVGTFAYASTALTAILDKATLNTKDLQWYAKYADTLDHYAVPFSADYTKSITRKEFLVIAMKLLKAVGL